MIDSGRVSGMLGVCIGYLLVAAMLIAGFVLTVVK